MGEDNDQYGGLKALAFFVGLMLVVLVFYWCAYNLPLTSDQCWSSCSIN